LPEGTWRGQSGGKAPFPSHPPHGTAKRPEGHLGKFSHPKDVSVPSRTCRAGRDILRPALEQFLKNESIEFEYNHCYILK
jgi:hypothetical protein